LSNSLLSANAATTFGVALALINIFNARSLSTVCVICMSLIKISKIKIKQTEKTLNSLEGNKKWQ